jgi:hypothetical protein
MRNLNTWSTYVAVCLHVQEALFSGPSRDVDFIALKLSGLTYTRLGKAGRRSPALWGDEHASRSPPSPLRPWELSDAFLEGMSLLQLYPVEAAGGIDIILQTALYMTQRREEDAKVPKGGSFGLGARLKVTMWKGFTNQLPSSVSDEEATSEEEDTRDDGNETETLSSSGITSRLANSVWRGITNQSAMEVPPSPLTPLTPLPSLSHSLESTSSSPSTVPSVDSSPKTNTHTLPGPNIWGYAEKLKDSDAAASLAKASSNWRAKAMDAWNARKKNAGNTEALSPTSTTSELPPSTAAWNPWMHSPITEPEDRRRESLRMDRSDVYSPPPRPAFFRPPRDSFIPPARGTTPMSSSPTTPDMSPQSDSSIVHRTKASIASMAGLSSALPPPKQGPRPLRLNSAQLMTARKPSSMSRSATNTSAPYQAQWAEVMRAKGHVPHKDSHSSISSLSPSDAMGRGCRSDAEYETGKISRVVLINRRSVSPMAPGYRVPQSRPLSTESSPDKAMQPASQHEPSDNHPEEGWGRVDIPDSPPFPTSPIPYSSATDAPPDKGEVRIANGEHERLGSIVLSDSIVTPEAPPPKKLTRKKTPPRQPGAQIEDASIPPVPSLNARVRSKRYPQRPSNLRTKSRSSTVPDKVSTLDSLGPDDAAEQEVVVPTPRAAAFDVSESSSTSPTSPQVVRRSRKVSTEGHEARVAKMSAERPTIRKIPLGGRDMRGKRESAANEGDDEGYGDLLTAYESED